jgi:CO/xanthine dehydrogenase Mo-binding subunit
VAATNLHIAADALKLIEVDYEILPVVLDPARRHAARGASVT